MQKILALGFVAVLASLPVTAIAAKNAITSSQLRVTATFSPAPMKQGTETITIGVTDAAGKPVKGATVKIASNMPTMSMSGPTLVARDRGNGIYVTKERVNFATTWTFDIAATAGARSGHTRLTAVVK